MTQKISSRERAVPASQEGWISQESSTWKNALCLLCSSWWCVQGRRSVAELSISPVVKAEQRKMCNRNKGKQLLFSHISAAFSHVQPGLVLQVWAVCSLSHGWCQSRSEAYPQCKCQLWNAFPVSCPACRAPHPMGTVLRGPTGVTISSESRDSSQGKSSWIGCA